jgi:hypothetical protein
MRSRLRVLLCGSIVALSGGGLTISTFGGSCIPDADRTDASVVDASTVEVRPYDQLHSRCSGDALRFYLSHSSTISFAQPGVARIRIIGDKGGVIGGDARTPSVIERIVVVR